MNAFEMCISARFYPRLYFTDAYLLHGHLALKFLSNLDQERGFGMSVEVSKTEGAQKAKVVDHKEYLTMKKVNHSIEQRMKDYIKYDIKYEPKLKETTSSK